MKWTYKSGTEDDAPAEWATNDSLDDGALYVLRDLVSVLNRREATIAELRAGWEDYGGKPPTRQAWDDLVAARYEEVERRLTAEQTIADLQERLAEALKARMDMAWESGDGGTEMTMGRTDSKDFDWIVTDESKDEDLIPVINEREATIAELREQLELARNTADAFANTIRLLTEENLTKTLPRLEKAEALLRDIVMAASLYRSQFGQGFEAHGWPLSEAQEAVETELYAHIRLADAYFEDKPE